MNVYLKLLGHLKHMDKIPERPVFEWDEAISLQEIEKIWLKQIRETQKYMTMRGVLNIAQATLFCQQLLEDMVQWTRDGKPPLDEWAENKHKKEHDQD